jgi:predicted DNA-binding transcriptional regulator YafY
MELLSYGDTVKVIAPQKLAKKLQKQYQSALNQY